ncbi:MAG: efflux RND transporter periplasmic adaptor subunit [bacterium]
MKLKNYFKNIRGYIVKHKIISGLVAVIIVVGGYYLYNSTKSSGPTSYVLASVSRDTVVESVSATGQVSAESQVNVNPQGSGQVISVNVSNGDNVSAGQTIAVLDERNQLVALDQARAGLKSAQANYDSVVAGASSQTIAVSQASLDSAKLALSNANQNVIDKLNNAYNSAYNAIENTADQFFSNSQGLAPQFFLSGYVLNNQQLEIQLGSERASTGILLSKWKNDLSSLNQNSDMSAALKEGNSNLNSIGSFLDDLNLALNSYTFGSGVSSTNSSNSNSSSGSNSNGSGSNSNLANYQSSVSSARSNINSSISNLLSASQSIQSAQISLEQSQASFNLQVAPAATSSVASAEASLENAKATLNTAENNYQNNIITAPFDGIIGALSIQRGQQVSAGTAVATVLTNQKIANVTLNEVDAAKIKLGDPATLTFDAIPDLTIAGKVAEVDPVGTVTSGVVNYSIKIAFATQDSRIKPSMSVSAAIVSNVSQNTLVVPNSAIKTQGTSTYVLVANGEEASSTTSTIAGAVTLANTPVATVVQTGLSNDTETEIVSGLNEGDRVVTQTISSGTTKTTTAQSGLSLLGGSRSGGGAPGR